MEKPKYDELNMKQNRTNDETETQPESSGKKVKDDQSSNSMQNQIMSTVGTRMNTNPLVNMNAMELLNIIASSTSSDGAGAPVINADDGTYQFLMKLKAILPANVDVQSTGNQDSMTTNKRVDGIETSKTILTTQSLTNQSNEPPIIFERDTPNMINTDIQEMMIDQAINKDLKFIEGYFVTKNGYQTEINVDKLQGLVGIVQPASVITTAISNSYKYEDTVFAANTDLTEFYGKSRDVFNYGLQYMTHIFNPEFLKERGLLVSNGKMFLPKLQYTADSANLQNRSSYIAGNLQMMAVLGWFKDFLKTGSNISTVNVGAFIPPYNGQISSSVINLSSPNLYKASYLNYSLSPWINDDVADQMSLVNYRLGKVQEELRNNMVVSSVYAMDNIDQFTADLLNFNANLYLSNSNNLHLLVDRVKSYLLPDSDLHWNYSSDQLQCYIPPELNERLQYFFTTFCLAPHAYQQIYLYHSESMRTFLTPVPIGQVTFNDANTAINNQEKIIRDVFETRRSEVRGIQKIEHLLSMQIIPPIHHLRVVSSSLKAESTAENIMATLTTLSLFSLYFPLTFMMTIGYVQNWLRSVLQYFQKGRVELETFFPNNEIAYRKGANGNIEYLRTAKEWRQDYYDDGWLPLLHGLVYFRDAFPRRPKYVIDKIAGVLTPVGKWKDDSPEAVSSHPRVVPRHYLPFGIDYSETNSDLKKATSFRFAEIFALVTNKTHGPTTAHPGSSGSTSMSRVLLNILAESTNDFAYCLHAHVAHWLQTIANTGMAVLKNFPEDMYENPYSTYVLKGNITSRALTTSDGSFGTSVFDQIDYNAVLSMILQFRTPVLKQVKEREMLRLKGPYDKELFKYRNFPDAYIPLFEHDEEFYRAMEILTYLLGIIDLMTLNRYSIDGQNVDVFDEEDGALLGSVQSVNRNQFNLTCMQHLMMYGYDYDSLMVLDDTATPIQFDEIMNDMDMPKIFILTETVPDELKTHMLTLETPFFLIATNDLLTDVFTTVEFDNRTYDVNQLIQNIYPDIDLKTLLDPNDYTRNLVGTTWKEMLMTLAKTMSLDANVMTIVKNFNTQIGSKMDVGAKIIRREVAGRILPYDQNIDPVGLKNYLFGMNANCLQRLKIASGLVNNVMLPQIQKGIIIANTRVDKCLFYDMYDVGEATVYEFVPSMITFITNDDNEKIIRLFLDGETLDWFGIVDKIVIDITLKQLFAMRADYKSYLQMGITLGKCALRMLDYEYTFEVVSNPSSVNDWSIVIPESYSYGIIGHLKFYDTTSRPLTSASAPVSSNTFVKYIYPLQDLRTSFPVLGLEASNEKRIYSKIQLDNLYDTGPWLGTNTRNVVNRFTDPDDVTQAGTLKTLSTDKISMSNYLTVLRSKSMFEAPFQFSVVDPQYDLSQ